jgi:hypothetical protein
MLLMCGSIASRADRPEQVRFDETIKPHHEKLLTTLVTVSAVRYSSDNV